MISREKKAMFVILGVLLVIILAISIPLFLSSRKKNNEEFFPDYEEIDVRNITKDTEKIKSQIENDPYFAREALISNYYYKNYTSADLQNMLWNFIFSYGLTNTKYININKSKGVFCMRSRYVPEAFKELYGVNILADMEILNGYFQYVIVEDNSHCFYYANVADEYHNNELYVGIDALQVENNIVTANVYLYEFYIMNTDSELNNLDVFKNRISNSDYVGASKIVEDTFNGKVTHKQLEFTINNYADHFKYQILSSKMLDY